MNDKYKGLYDKRWKASMGTQDDDILVLSNPKRQVEFFYYIYNRFISETIQEKIGNCEDKKLLEIGCGRATSSIYQALELGINVFPTDYSEEALKIAKKNLRKYHISADPRKENLYDMSFEDETFDVIISLGVMEHIAELEKAYREMERVLKPNGVMISMNVPEKPENIQRVAVPVNKILSKIKNFLKREDAKPWLDKETRSKTADVYRSYFTSKQFGETVADSGFENVSVVELNPFPTFDPVPGFIDHLIVRLFRLILLGRKFFLPGRNPAICSEENSRVHFIVAQKRMV